MNDLDVRARELELEYRSFLDDRLSSGKYHAKVETMLKHQETRLIVNINDTRKDPNFKARAQGLVENSVEELVAFQRALKEFVLSLDPIYGRSVFEFHVGISGSFGSRHVTPRTLTSKFLNNTVCIEGIVSKVSLVRPRLVKSVLYCPKTHKVIERRHYDFSSLDYQPNSASIETKDEDGNPLELEHGDSIYKDSQMLTIQEMPESSPPGQLPRCTDVYLDWDLVDSCKPGDRVQIVGSYRCLPYKQGNYTNCIFRSAVLANYVEQISKEVADNTSPDDVKKCKKQSQRKNIFNLLARSLAPTIHGHDHVKQAILLQLLGGVEKNLPNGTRLRGDINLLLIGDPSVAKSQLLRFVLGIAPRAIATTGRGSSGVGLTAAVTTDPDTGDRRLEAGAMVLADRGIVCVDEFDKMSDLDRTAIHEVMEQGRVTICKAGIQASLNARCSVLAAANPICGNYDPYKLPMENIGLQDSLLSRFDLLFIMLDEHDRENDKNIATHVARIHRYRPLEELDGEPTVLNPNVNHLSTLHDDDDDEHVDMDIYDKHNPLLHGSRKFKRYSMEFLRKYIHVARKMKPVLTEEASDLIGREYAALRSYDEKNSNVEGGKHAKTQPITARTLETLIRLSTAHAKARHNPTVDVCDAQVAIDLLELSVFRKVLDRPKPPRKHRLDDVDDTSEMGDEPNDHVINRDQNASENVEIAAPRDNDCVAPSDTSGPSTADKATLGAKFDDFADLLNTLSQNGLVDCIGCDLIRQEAQRVKGFTPDQVDVLIQMAKDKDIGVVDSDNFYFVH